MNTLVSYVYGRVGRYVQTRSFVVTGVVTFEELEPFLDDGKFFVPEDVGLKHPEPVEGYVRVPRNDGPFYELSDLSETTFSSDVGMDAMSLIERFRAAHAAGWPGGSGANQRDITFFRKPTRGRVSRKP